MHNYRTSHISRASRPTVSPALHTAMFLLNLTKSADRIDRRLALVRKAEKERNYQQKMEDQHKAARAASSMMQAEELEPGATGYAKLTLRWADHCPWSVLRECYDDLMARPGAGFAFRYLFQEAQKAVAIMDKDQEYASLYILEGMADFLCSKAWERLTVYLDILDWNRWHKKDEKKQVEDRPADMYRDYGPMLQMAAGLEFPNAQRTYRQLALQATMPFTELDNPDWIEPYTGMGVKGYEQIRVRKVEEVSSDGNPIPAYVQSMMDDLGYATIEGFERMMGCSVSEYHTQFMEAQRSGYNEFVGADLEQEEGDVPLDAEEKDFQYSQDLKVERDDIEALMEKIQDEIKAFREAVDENADDLRKMWAGWKDQRHALSEKLKTEKASKQQQRKAWKDQDAKQEAETLSQHALFLATEPVSNYLKALQDLLHHHETAEVMALLYHNLNTFALWEDDLYQLRVFKGGWHNLAIWFDTMGDEFLDQFSGDERPVRYDEVPEDTLDQISTELMLNMQTVYHWGEERRQKWNEKRLWSYIDEMGRRRFVFHPVFHVSKMTGLPLVNKLKYQQDVTWNPAYVSAEVMMAFVGEGGTKQMSDAGWDAFRQQLDPEANYEYRRLIAKGKTREEANAAFWSIFRGNQNRIKTITKEGLVLRSGRKIDWGIAKLKIEKGEIPLTEPDMMRLRDILVKNRMGGYLIQFIQKVLEGARVIEMMCNFMRMIGIEEADPLDMVLADMPF